MNTISAEKKIVYINYFDSIDERRAKDIMSICAELIGKHQAKELYFLFASPGGSVNAGIALFNYLQALPCEITMHNTGTIDSIATVIFLAGKNRFAAPHSTFLYHGIKMNFHQGSSISSSELKEVGSRLTHDEDKIVGIICEKTKITESEMRMLLKQGESKNLAFAKEKGIIQEIRNPIIPEGAPFISINFNY